MAQDSTYNLPNIDRGAASRAKLNSIFEAVKTQNSGGSEPASPSAFMLWADSATDYLKIRNEANTNWNIIGKLGSEGLVLTSAGNPNGAVTGLYEGQLLFDTSNNIPWYYSGSSTSWLTSNGTALSFNLPPNYHDMQIEYLTVSTIRIKAGSRCRSADNTKDVIFASNYTVDMSNATPTSTTGGRSVAELANQMYCIYVGLDSAGLPLAWLDTADLSAGGTPTNPAAYSSSRRQLKFLIRNDGSSNILNFLITGNFYEYLDSILVYSTVVLTGTPVTVSASGYVPAGERSALFTYAHNSNGSQSYLQVQSRVGGAQFFVGSANTTSHIGFGMYTIGLNSSGQHNINAATNTSNTTIYLRGYYV